MRVEKIKGKRTPYFASKQDVKKKYILAFEGQETEYQYFNGVDDNREEIGINPLIQFHPLLRSIPQETWGHPKHVHSLVKEHIEEFDSPKVIIDKLMDYCFKESIITNNHTIINDLIQDLYKFTETEIGIDLNQTLDNTDVFLSQLLSYFQNRIDLLNQIEHIKSYIKKEEILFAKERDCICIIIDRDRGSFSDKQYDEILNKCKESNYRLFVSNPTFEFWLLLHSNNIITYDKTELLENKKTGDKRHLERILSKEFNGYNKSNLVFKKFLPNIDLAIDNEKLFCEEIEKLKYDLGTNIGTLLVECRNR